MNFQIKKIHFMFRKRFVKLYFKYEYLFNEFLHENKGEKTDIVLFLHNYVMIVLTSN